MFNIVIDSDKSFNNTDSICKRQYGFDFASTEYEGNYKMGVAIITHTHADDADVTESNFQSVHLNGLTLCNYQASNENSSKTADLIGFVVKTDNQYKSIDNFIQTKVKINPTASQIEVVLKKADGSLVDVDFKYKLVLTFKKCSCSD